MGTALGTKKVGRWGRILTALRSWYPHDIHQRLRANSLDQDMTRFTQKKMSQKPSQMMFQSVGAMGAEWIVQPRVMGQCS